MQDAQEERPPLAAGFRIAQKALSEVIRVDPRSIRFCCGHPIEPHLAEIREYSGPSLFMSVWRCPHCGRVTS